MTPIKADFDKAVEQPWNGRTCIIAQMMIRHGMRVAHPTSVFSFINTIEMTDARYLLDILFKNPGDEQKQELQKLRASLPDSE